MVDSSVLREIVLCSRLESLNEIESLTLELREQFDLSVEQEANILVVLSEAVSNAIVHGNRLNPDRKVTVQYWYEDGKLMFRISDEGQGFDPSTLADPTAPQNLLKPTGRGIFLMRRLADAVDFSDGGRTVTLTFRL
ncbi:MAG: ATP-binding protein [Chitinophagales bacterium]|nr:ATP-binding protein [Chitinophagales bacterium]MDW8428834.1 ATP-binding protein [Chitinophagales bacterium]